MKKLLQVIWMPIAGLGLFFAGFFIRQPKINKLKKQISRLEREFRNQTDLNSKLQGEFEELFIQYKALRVIDIMKKTESKEKIKGNLIMQYALREYLELLIRRVKKKEELEKEEIQFLDAFEDVVNGKQLSSGDI